uniref:uncharacterized protein LOC100178202 isoform X2 n=1 Tax=Ciona intestinalis TaxID=7719 RepID=UPI000EF4E31A|nr:uncharacterized protein LOC100178202 isoform X2 [Ciona intestinalis]|eukprot:XP_026691084.1 uncharacterized protein LOC100178202 isoform X2 [Ciona intestinalis]
MNSPRSRLSIEISPNPPEFLKLFHVKISFFESHNYNTLIYHVVVWAGTGPKNTSKLIALDGDFCADKKYHCKGKIGDKYIYSRIKSVNLPWFYTFYNISGTLVNENGQIEACVKLETSLV